MAQAKAAGTMVNYDCMTRKFAAFCEAKQYAYPDFTEKAAMHFVVLMDKDGATMGHGHLVTDQARPGSSGDVIAGKQGSSFTDTVDILLNAAKREQRNGSQSFRRLDDYRRILCRGCIPCIICLI
jgi:hypothetical protein